MSLSKMLCLILYHLSLIPILQIGWSTLSWFPSQCLCKLTSQMISYRQVKGADALGVWAFWCSVNVITKHHIRNTICIPWLSKMINIFLFALTLFAATDFCLKIPNISILNFHNVNVTHFASMLLKAAWPCPCQHVSPQQSLIKIEKLVQLIGQSELCQHCQHCHLSPLSTVSLQQS